MKTFEITKEQYKKYVNYANKICFNCRFLVDDVLHTVLDRIVLNPPQDIEYSIDSYIYTSLINEKINKLRFYNRHVDIDFVVLPIESYEMDKDYDEYDELYRRVDLLPFMQRKITKLFLSDKSLVDIAKEENINYNTVKATFRHAITKLREI